jgi:hypothetical protein
MPKDPEGTLSAAVPATIDPDRFEDYEGFRETTLAVFTDPKSNTALRVVTDLLYTMGLEHCRHWPEEPEGSFIHQARAALADLRHLQGYLAHLGKARTASALTAKEARHSALCETLALHLKAVADALETDLRPPPPSLPPLYRYP